MGQNNIIILVQLVKECGKYFQEVKLEKIVDGI